MCVCGRGARERETDRGLSATRRRGEKKVSAPAAHTLAQLERSTHVILRCQINRLRVQRLRLRVVARSERCVTSALEISARHRAKSSKSNYKNREKKTTYYRRFLHLACSLQFKIAVKPDHGPPRPTPRNAPIFDCHKTRSVPLHAHNREEKKKEYLHERRPQ